MGKTAGQGQSLNTYSRYQARKKRVFLVTRSRWTAEMVCSFLHMTADEFRKLALSFQEAEERSHMDHPDFRVGGKIFATIAPGGERGMVKLTPEQQAALTRSDRAFEPAAGAWGRNGSTMVTFLRADEKTVRQALAAAWNNTAPKRLLNRLADSL